MSIQEDSLTSAVKRAEKEYKAAAELADVVLTNMKEAAARLRQAKKALLNFKLAGKR